MRLATLPLVVLLALVSWASGQVTDGQWTYIVEDGGATITASTATGAVTIPSVLGGYAVKKVGNSGPPVFGYPNTSVLSVSIPNSVTNIGGGAFQSCTGLTSVSIGNSVTSIEDYAFDGCTGLTSVVIPFYITPNPLAFPVSVAFTRDYTSLVGRSDFVTSLVDKLANTLATNSTFITNLAEAIKSANGTYGIATQVGVSDAIITATSALATQAEITTAINEGKASGIASVTASPNTWSLFTTSQIQNMAVGDLVLSREVNGSFVLNYDIEQSEDLFNWTPYVALSLPLTGLPTDKAFIRIRAKQ